MSRYGRRGRKPQEDSTVRHPDPHCRRCLGTGWVRIEELVPVTRETPEGTARYAPGMTRCECTRVQTSAIPETEEIDRARKAAGERSEG
jgi:hypothetical protein